MHDRRVGIDGDCRLRHDIDSIHNLSPVSRLDVAQSTVQFDELRGIAQHDSARCQELNRRSLRQERQRARYGLNRQAKIVGDMLARHRELHEALDCQTFRHVQKKRRDPLLRGLDQQQRVILGALQLASRD